MPASNPYSVVKAELGRLLFYDRRLSIDGSYACASCHQQRHAFTDGRQQAVGATGEHHRRNTMSLANVVYASSFNWADAETASLEQQALVPMFGTAPIELGLAGHEQRVLAELAELPRYRQLFAAAFAHATAPITIDNAVRAIATFERTLISAGSPYDRYVQGADRSALSAGERRGLSLFFSPRLACAECHRGFDLAGNTSWYHRPPTPLTFHNTGLYNLGRGAYPAVDQGRIEITSRRRDMGRFKAPTLRNIELTAPYMHDGSIATLEEALAHYQAGGRARPNRYQSRRIRRLDLSESERRDLLTFLRSLTDHEFVSNPRFSDPFLP